MMMKSALVVIALCAVASALPFQEMNGFGWVLSHNPSFQLDSLPFPSDPDFGTARVMTAAQLNYGISSPPNVTSGLYTGEHSCQMACDVNPKCGFVLWSDKVGEHQCWILDAAKVITNGRLSISSGSTGSTDSWHLYRHVLRVSPLGKLLEQPFRQLPLPFHRFYDFSQADSSPWQQGWLWANPNDACTQSYDSVESAWRFQDDSGIGGPSSWCNMQLSVPDGFFRSQWRIRVRLKTVSSDAATVLPGRVLHITGYPSLRDGHRFNYHVLMNEVPATASDINMASAFRDVIISYSPASGRSSMTVGSDFVSSVLHGEEYYRFPVSMNQAGSTPDPQEIMWNAFHIGSGCTDCKSEWLIQSIAVWAFAPFAAEQAQTQVALLNHEVQDLFDANFVCKQPASPASVRHWCSLRQ